MSYGLVFCVVLCNRNFEFSLSKITGGLGCSTLLLVLSKDRVGVDFLTVDMRGLPSVMVRWQGLSETMSTESLSPGPRTCKCGGSQ